MLRTLRTIYSSAKEVYSHLGTGHSEAVYHKAMETELRLNGVQYSTKCPISIQYKGHIVGYNEPDLLVKVQDVESDTTIVVELKATTYPPRETEKAQLHSYLRTINTSFGVLINFPQPTGKTINPEEIHFLKYGFDTFIQKESDIEFKLPTGIPSVPTLDLNDSFSYKTD